MGRKPTRWTNLPPGMRARERGQKVHYYLDTGGKPRKEIPLGNDFLLAVKKWAELTSAKKPAGTEITMPHVIERYFAEIVPSKALNTQKGDLQEKEHLLKFFGDPPAPLDAIEPTHIHQFMKWRPKQAKAAAAARNRERAASGRDQIAIPPSFGQTRANRAKALLSHMWNFARAEGLTSLPNPCAGIHRYTETGRDTAPDQELLSKVIAHADRPLQFALRLADLIGQRPGDLRRLSESDIRDGMLHIRQGKTSAKLRIEITGMLADLLAEIREYKSAMSVHSMRLLVNEDGQPLEQDAMRYRFDKAREAAGIKKEEFQFRDLRAKAATEADEASGTRSAQAILGHTTEAMTASYVRHKVGRKVAPRK
ncbi:tyrosine-type recombinase/integrase [Comamonas sp.]|uniref:tyrosine-type recombinase/integrase n=1 Tax=Comamonas sp. TaxID=34028 RepID=UPI003D0DA9F2